MKAICEKRICAFGRLYSPGELALFTADQEKLIKKQFSEDFKAYFTPLGGEVPEVQKRPDVKNTVLNLAKQNKISDEIMDGLFKDANAVEEKDQILALEKYINAKAEKAPQVPKQEETAPADPKGEEK